MSLRSLGFTDRHGAVHVLRHIPAPVACDSSLPLLDDPYRGDLPRPAMNPSFLPIRSYSDKASRQRETALAPSCAPLTNPLKTAFYLRRLRFHFPEDQSLTPGHSCFLPFSPSPTHLSRRFSSRKPQKPNSRQPAALTSRACSTMTSFGAAAQS